MKRRRRMTAEMFVRIWQKATSPTEAAKELGMSVGNASARASYLRGQGVPLRNYKPRVNIKSLAKLAKESA